MEDLGGRGKKHKATMYAVRYFILQYIVALNYIVLYINNMNTTSTNQANIDIRHQSLSAAFRLGQLVKNISKGSK